MMRPWKINRYSLAIICFVLLNILLVAASANAQSVEAANGLNWLKSNQNADGSWGNVNSLRDTSAVIDAYKIIGETDLSFSRGVSWVGGISAESNDYIARRIISLSGTGADVNPDLEKLVLNQNFDGGWGYFTGFESNVYDTAIVLHALKVSQFQNTAVITKGINYLISKQNVDGSWGLLPGITGDIVTTSLVVSILKNYEKDVTINGGASWLNARQNPDGGFGNSLSNINETSFALIALIQSGQIQLQQLQNAVNYLTTNQLANGSWNENAYKTAMAIKALTSLKPNLSISTSDISISSLIPKSGEIIKIRAIIRNIGAEDAYNIPVQIFIETPDQQVTQLGTTQIIPMLQVGSQLTIEVDFDTKNREGLYKILVKIDSENTITELTKENNQAIFPLSIKAVPDLVIFGENITLSRSLVNIGEDVTVTAAIANQGNYTAENIYVKFYYDAISQETFIGEGYIPYLLPGETATREVVWKANKAGKDINIYAVANSQNDELTKDNNQAFKLIEVLPVRDANLTVSYKDISLNPTIASQNGSVEISVLIKNNGFSPADSVEVAFYNGVPEASGMLLGSRFIQSIPPNSTAAVSYNWANITDSGERIIYIKADPSNVIKEFIEDDNDAFTTLKILSLPDLAISTNSIAFAPSAPKDGDTVSIAVTVKNLGEQDASSVTVRASEGATVIGSQIIPSIAGNSQATASFIYNTTGKSGAHEITVAVDPDNAITEQSEDNNRASRAFGVQDANLWVTEQYISPNGDNGKDSSQFFFRLSAAQTVKIVIANEKGAIVRTFSGPEFGNSTGGNITWDGLNDNGMVVDDGQYQIQVRGLNDAILSSLIVTVDNNRSPLTKAIGTKHLLNNNLTCTLPDIWYWEWFPDESGILFKLYFPNPNTPEYPTGLYTMTPDGKDILRIVPWGWSSDPKYDYYYGRHELSPDGERIIFSVNKLNRGIGYESAEIWIVDRDGRNLTLIDSYDLTQNRQAAYFDFKWSPNGEYIIYKQEGQKESWIVKPDGTAKMMVDSGDIDFYRLQWSPDGKNIAYPYVTYDLDGNPISWTIRLSDTTGNKKDIFSTNGYTLYLEWLNNQKIVLSDEEVLTWVKRLWLIDASGAGNHIKLSDNFGGEIYLSPDRQSIAFTASANDNAYLNVSDINGNIIAMHEFKSTSQQIRNIVWPSDGSKIAFIEETLWGEGYGGDDISTEYIRNLVVIDMRSEKKTSFAISNQPYQFYQLVGWLSDGITLIVVERYSGSIYAINSETGENISIVSGVFLYGNNLLSPLERYITYYQATDSSSGCYGRGAMDLWAISSLLNLTADLRVSKQKSAVILKGIAADLNFEGYALEYADAKNPDVWNLVAPPSDVPVINDVFTTWVPPYEGTFYVRLTVWDKAGNKAIDRKRVSWGLSSSITNIYKSLEIFSPNGDGVKDTVELRYRVLEPVHLEFYIYDKDNNLTRTFYKDYATITDDFITWDGRDEANKVVPDGKYKIKVFDYEFFVEVDNTPPGVGVVFCPDAGGEVCEGIITPEDSNDVKKLLAVASDKNIKSWIIEYGEGDNPQEWYEFKKGYDNLRNFTIPPHVVIGAYSNGSVEWLVGKKFRITAEDYVGNIRVEFSDFLKEKIVLYKWDAAFVSGGIPNNLAKPGIHSITGLETIKTQIKSLNLQYTQDFIIGGGIGATAIWIDSQTAVNYESGQISLKWDSSNLDLLKPFAVRIKAIDIFGQEYYSNIIYAGSGFAISCTLDLECDFIKGANLISEPLKLLKLQIISDEDPNYPYWTDYKVYDTAKGDSIPVGVFCLPKPPMKPGIEYKINMTGISTSGNVYESGFINYPTACSSIELFVGISYPSAEGCGLNNKAVFETKVIAPEKVLLSLSPKTLSYYIQKPEGLQLLQQLDLTGRKIPIDGFDKGKVDASKIDYSANLEGSYPIKAVFKYLDSSENRIKEVSNIRYPQPPNLIVERVLPTAQITYPPTSMMVCPIKYNINGNEFYGIPIEGRGSDNSGVDYEISYGIGENPQEWKFDTIRMPENKPFLDEERHKSFQGLLGFMVIDKLKDATTYSIKLKVIDYKGNASCSTTSFSFDKTIEIKQLTIDKSIFSGVFDVVNISYQIDENSTVDVRVFRLLQRPDGTYALDTTAVRTIVSGLQHLSGTENTSWDGRGDSGAAVPDGKYGIAVFATDSCNNTTMKWAAVEVDNTPPTTVIAYPRPGDPLGNIVEVKGTAEDVHFKSYILEYGQGDNPDAWLFISSNTTPVKDNILGKWNTFGLDGRWTLRLTGYDTVGNKNTTVAAIDLGVRKTLIKDLSAEPRLFSPNNDGRLDATSIKYELTDACQVNIDILDANGAVKKGYTTTVQSAGVYTYSWDGKDNAGAAVPDGAYTVRLTAILTSNTSVTQTEAVTVVVDTTLPTIDIKQPVNDSYIRTDISVNGIINDMNLIEYSVTNTGVAGAALLDQGNQNRQNYTFGILNELAEDRYTLNVRARDFGENIVERNIIFTIDKTAPKVVLDAPKDGEYYGSDKNIINITGSIVEKNLETFSLRYGLGENPAQWTNLLTGNTIPASPQLFAWKVGKNDGIPDGLYTISLYAKDKAGAEAEVKVKVTIDNTLPEAAITSPVEGGYVKAAIDVKGTAFDQNLDKYTVEISEGRCASAFKWVSIKSSDAPVRDAALVQWQTIPPDGDYCLRLTVIDKVGSKAEARLNVKIDTQPPAIPVLSGKIENKSNINLSWTQNAEPDLAGYNLYRDGKKINAALISNTTYLDQSLTEGIYTYTVTALDLAGNESKPSNEIKLKVDLTGPDARIRSQQDGTMVSGLVDIKGTAYSSDDFKQYRVYIGNGAAPATWSLIRTSPVPIPYGTLAQWDTIGLSEGLYSIKLEAEDLSGNINIHQITAAIDNTPPAAPVLISATANGSDATAAWQANTEPDLAGYLLYRNDQIANVSGIVIGNLKPYLITGTTYPDRALPDGRFNYYLIAMDQAGNMSGQSNVIEVNIDTRAPKADIVEPLDRSKLQNKTFIKAESPDLDIASIQFQYKAAQDSAWLNLGIPAAQMPYAAYLDPAALGLIFGDYNLRAVATDLGAKTDPSPSFITITYTDLTPPAAPISLKALTNGRDVSLTWTANTETDLDGYNIYRISGAARTKINASIIKNTAYQDIGLSDGSYTYEATAVDIYSNESKPSNSAPAKVYAPVLSQPYTPTGQKTIAINGSNAEANSSVEMTVEAVGSLLIVTASSDSNGNFTGNVELTLGENRITAKATDSAGNVSRASDMVVVVYNESPAAPIGLTTNINGYDINLTWNPNSEPDLSGYNLYKNGEKVNKPAKITSGNVSASSYAYYNPPLRAFDGDISTYWMPQYSYGDFNPVWLEIALPSAELINRVEIQWGSEPDYQDNEILYAGRDYEIQVWSGYAWITQTKIVGNNANTNTFDFKPSYRTDKIRIYITDTTDVNYSKVVRLLEVKIQKDNLITPSSYNDINLKDGIYSYRAAAVDYYGFEGPVSDEARATVGDVIPPSAPVNLTAAALGSDIILSWSSNTEPDLSGYNVYRNSAQGWVRINTALITGTAYTDIGLINGTYTYRVTAVDNVGNEGLPSNEASVIVNIALPQPPVNLRITAVPEGSSLNALWEYTGNASGYNIYRAEATGGPYTKVNVASITGTSYLDRGLANGAIYYYVVAALDSVGNESVYSNEASGIASDTIPPAKPEIFFPTLTGIPVVIYKDKTDISGAAEPGSTVELFKDGASMGKTTALENNLVQDIMINYNGDGASVSPDGKLLSYAYNNSIWLEDIAAGNTTQIIQNGYSPLWSPDGRRLAYIFQDNNWNNRIGIYEIETGQSSQLTDDTNVYESAPSWSGDGKKIAFISNRGGLQDVWVKDITTGLFSKATNSGNVTEAKLSPDGNWAAYFEYQNLYLIDLLTGNISPVDTQTDGYSISWSPDSKRLAFVSYRNGNSDIFYLDVTTKGQIQITNSVNGEFNPVWSPDGRSIIFARQDGSRSSIWVASPNTQEQIVKQNLYNLNYLSWARSGGIVYIEQNRLNIVYLKGYFNLKDIQLTAGENIFYTIASDSSGNASEPSERINVVFDTNLMPDLEITAQDIFIYPPYPVAGEDVAIYAVGWNRGKAEVRDVNADIYLLDSRGNLELLKSENIPYIAPESAVLIDLSWNSSDKLGRNSVIAFIDPDDRIYELRETNNLAAKELFVMGSEGILMETRLNSDRYQFNQDVNINVGLKNSGIGKDVTLAVMIEDERGNIAVSLNPVNASIPYASGEEFNLTWNSGNTYAGAYRVHSVLRDASGIIAENVVPFALIYDINIDSSITTDRTNYGSRENVALSVNIKSSGRNYIIPELAVNIKTTDSNNNVLFNEGRALKNVMPDVVNTLNSVWNTGLSQPGSYNASVDVYNNNQLVSTKTASFIIDSALIITGNIAAAPTIVMHGKSVQVDYTVRNSGNMNAVGLPLRLLVINPEDQSIMNSMENAVGIPINGSQTGQFIFSTQGYKLKPYAVVLQSAYQAGTKSIASASFTVRDGTPPAINILSPVSGAKYNTGFDIAAVAADDASGVDRVEYQIDNGAWRLLPISDQSTGRYSTRWAPVIADEGVHTISFRAIDKAGNMSEPVSTGIIIEVLFGAITAQPAQVYQGKDVAIAYTITNNANEDIANLNVKIVIVDADTQEIKQTFEIMPNIPMNTTITGSLILSTTTLAPKIYIARLEAATAAMSAPKTLASATFNVKPAIEAAKTMPDVTNLLVWVNEKCGEESREHTVYSSQEKGHDKEDDKEKCIRIDLLENILKQAVASYFIVYDKKDFEAQLRNPYYTDILILGDHHPLEDHYADELRELVHSGKGLISSLYLKKGGDHEENEHKGEDQKDEYNTLFGIRYRGRLSAYEHQVKLLDSPISAAGALKAIGEAIKAEANNPEAVAAWIENEAGHNGKQKEHPGIVLNNYGIGRTIFFAFDLGKTINDENRNQMSDLIKNSIAYIHKPVDANLFYPNQLIPVEIKVKSLGGNFDLRITESYPAELKLYDPLTGKWIADNPWVINLQLKPDETKTILYYALMPDRAGAYSLQTEIGYMDNGDYNFYQSLSIEIKIEKDVAATAEDVITALKRLTVAVKEKEKLDTAIRYIENIQSRTITSEQDVEKNIHDILKAIESLLSITSTDAASERLMIDRILGIWENKHYFNIY